MDANQISLIEVTKENWYEVCKLKYGFVDLGFMKDNEEAHKLVL